MRWASNACVDDKQLDVSHTYAAEFCLHFQNHHPFFSLNDWLSQVHQSCRHMTHLIRKQSGNVCASGQSNKQKVDPSVCFMIPRAMHQDGSVP